MRREVTGQVLSWRLACVTFLHVYETNLGGEGRAEMERRQRSGCEACQQGAVME